jgi:hypothetical protein
MCIIDTKEGRDVTVIDIPNAFFQMQVEDKVDMAIIKIRGVLVDILVQIAPNVYKSYVTTDKKGTKQLLVQCQNALYGTMVASLLYYHKFTKSLMSVGFEINPYDPCVANKIVNGMQMTICFHKDDWNKLTHLMKYLRGTRTLPLILSANGTGILKWWLDAAFAVHPNMQGHSPGGLSLGRGFPIVSLTKQKLNTQSSTESEIVGADDFMTAICWTQYFMEAQGYQVQDNILFQDNKSAILLEKNGKASSDNFRMNTGMVDMAPLIIWLV